MPNISPSKAKKTALRLLRENRHGRSWRVIAREDFDGAVHFATINRFATHRGQWVPKDPGILTALGLVKPRKPRRARTLQELTYDELIALGERLNKRLGDVAREVMRRRR